MVDDDGYTRCEVCDRRYEPGQPSADWLDVTVERDDHYANPDFCSQEHAAQWFAQPSLELEPSTPFTPMQRTTRDRLVDIALALPFIAIAAFLGIGLWTVIHWIWW